MKGKKRKKGKKVYENEKIIHSRSMRDFLLENGGIIKRIRPDLLDPENKEIYIFKQDTINGLMAKYKSKSSPAVNDEKRGSDE